MNTHTKEPWHVSAECYDNDGMPESVIRGLDGRSAIAVTLEFGPNNLGMREANAKRIVLCVNACAYLSTETLENISLMGDTLRDRFAVLNTSISSSDKKIDELLAVLEGMLTNDGGSGCYDAIELAKYRKQARAEIAKSKEDTQ